MSDPLTPELHPGPAGMPTRVDSVGPGTAPTQSVSLDFDPFAEPGGDGPLGLDDGFALFNDWLKARTLELIDAELHAERLMRRRERPVFGLICVAPGADLARLARTTQSLAQQLYNGWTLTVISDVAAPSPVFASDVSGPLRWRQVGTGCVDADIHHELTGVIAAGDADWIAVLPAGVELDINALLVLGDYLATHAAWLALYTDDDRIDDSGQRYHPRFKPDFDIDHLRGFDYVSPAAWVRRDAIVALGGLAPLGDATIFEFLLRLWESVGDEAIGHIPQPLLHVPVDYGTFDRDCPLRDAAVQAHLERLALPASVRRGLCPGARMVVWSMPTPPPVTIVIPTRDKTEYAIPCVETLLSRTDYPDYEVLIIDHDSEDPDLLVWLDAIVAHTGGRVRVMRVSGPFNFASMCNQAVAESLSDFICFLNNDTEIIQPEWLSRLVALASRNDAGAVGPRLVHPQTGLLQHTGYILGLEPDGVAGTAHAGLRGIRDPGPLNRLQVTRGCSALSASCMLLRRADFLAIGGMDEALLPVMFGDIDLCLKLREAGRRILWTPFVTVVHHGAVTLSSDHVMPSRRTVRNTLAQPERLVMQRRWLQRLVADPFYNRNLSLIERDFRLEVTYRPSWDTAFRDRRRVLGIPLAGGSGIYRVREPFDAVADAGRIQAMYPLLGKGPVRLPTPLEIARLAPDSLLLHAGLDDNCLTFLERNRRINPGVFQVFALDDLVTQIPRKSEAWKPFMMLYRDAKPRLQAALALCDRLVVSTWPLAELCRGMIDDIVIVPNRLSHKWNGLQSRRNTGQRPRIGWVGALQHQGDLELIEPVVRALQHEADFVFMGMTTDTIRPMLREFHEPVPWEDYPAKLASLDLDIALAPLEMVPFNEAKSNLRLLEYGSVGWPVVCTDIFPYQQDAAPVTRVSNDPEAWIAAIRALIVDPERRAREGNRLRDWVMQGYVLADHLGEWEQALLR